MYDVSHMLLWFNPSRQLSLTQTLGLSLQVGWGGENWKGKRVRTDGLK